jgi:hypothetical protein
MKQEKIFQVYPPWQTKQWCAQAHVLAWKATLIECTQNQMLRLPPPTILPCFPLAIAIAPL